MKRILMVSYHELGNGGIQSVLMSIVRGLSKEYVFDVLVFTDNKGNYEEEFCSYGGQIYRIPWYEGSSEFHMKLDKYIRGPRIYRGALRILKEHGPYHAVHCHNYYEAAPVLSAAAVLHVPIRIVHNHSVIQMHRENQIMKALYHYQAKRIEQFATAKIGCTEEACKSFFANPDGSRVINNPYNERRFDPDKFEKRNTKELNLLQVGRIGENKNQLFSLKVVACIKPKRPDVTLRIVGFSTDSYKAMLEKYVRDNDLSDNVFFLPHDADTPLLLSQSAAMLLPSLYEGCPLVALETQAMGTRCYASDTITRMADCGGMTFLSLDDGPEVWAETILADYEKTKGCYTPYNVDRFKTNSVAAEYRALYKKP